MNNEPTTNESGLSPTESNLAQALVLIQRVLPRLDEPARATEVQTALRRALACVEAARRAHEEGYAPRRSTAGPHKVATSLAPEIAAVIAAAVAVTFDRPHRLVSVQQVQTPVPYLNVWALEGRTQIFHSHKIR